MRGNRGGWLLLKQDLHQNHNIPSPINIACTCSCAHTCMETVNSVGTPSSWGLPKIYISDIHTCSCQRVYHTSPICTAMGTLLVGGRMECAHSAELVPHKTQQCILGHHHRTLSMNNYYSWGTLEYQDNSLVSFPYSIPRAQKWTTCTCTCKCIGFRLLTHNVMYMYMYMYMWLGIVIYLTLSLSFIFTNGEAR